MWGKERDAPGDAMAGRDDVIIVEQRTTAATRSDPNVRLFSNLKKIKLKLIWHNIIIIIIIIINRWFFVCLRFYLPGESAETGLISTDDSPLSSVRPLKRRPAFYISIGQIERERKESWNQTKKDISKSSQKRSRPPPKRFSLFPLLLFNWFQILKIKKRTDNFGKNWKWLKSKCPALFQRKRKNKTNFSLLL